MFSSGTLMIENKHVVWKEHEFEIKEKSFF